MKPNLYFVKYSTSSAYYKLIVVFLILLPTVSVHAQKDKRPYREYSGVRYEGQKEVPYSGEALKIISFMGYNEGTVENEKCNIKIRFFFPFGEKDSLIIAAREVVKTTNNYFMEPVRKQWEPNKWQEFDNWPTQDVLVPLKITANKIGITGMMKITGATDEIIVPMNLYHSNLPDSITEYTVHLKVQDDLGTLKYELIENDLNLSVQNGQIKNVQSLAIYSIKLKLTGKPSGSYTLILKGEFKYDPANGPYGSYKFTHNPYIR